MKIYSRVLEFWVLEFLRCNIVASMGARSILKSRYSLIVRISKLLRAVASVSINSSPYRSTCILMIGSAVCKSITSTS